MRSELKGKQRAESDGVRGKCSERLERLVWNGWSSQGRLPCLNLNGEWWHGARVVCVEGRIRHPVSKRACDGEGTLRFQGYFPLFL